MFRTPSFLARRLPAVLISFAVGLGGVLASAIAFADHTGKDDKKNPAQSQLGEAFNEGPRQKAYLMDGMPKIRFPVSTKNETAQKFIEQGIGQLHGFWYFEAERSFRQAAMLDPDLAMAYWGMAQANVNNESRARGFIAEAVKRKGAVSERERMYIDAFDAYLKAGPKPKTDAKKDEKKDGDKKEEKKDGKNGKPDDKKPATPAAPNAPNAANTANEQEKLRGEKYVRDLERLLYKFPDDLEAKAFVVVQLWKNNRKERPITTYLGVDALLSEIFAADPNHPAHHYRIHLWDGEKPEKALKSAAVNGQTSPGVAHMWHMSGHTFSGLKRYDDAAWQQEASARVDHAHMMRDGVMPDQIHNFAHNNEWLIRDLIHIGRSQAALDLAKNMCELPRHPKYNTLARRGSAAYGRERLLDTLLAFELWDDLISLAATPYLEPAEGEAELLKHLKLVGMAHFRKGDLEGGRKILADARDRVEKKKAEQDKAGADAEQKAKEANKPEAEINKARDAARKPHDAKVKELEKVAQEIEAFELFATGKAAEAIELFKKVGITTPELLAKAHLAAGNKKEAEAAVRNHANSRKNEVVALANLADILWRLEKKSDAETTLKELREISGHIEDLSLPVFARLEPMIEELKLPKDWRVIKPAKSDIGVRPDLDSLGPFRWSPSVAPEWNLPGPDGKKQALRELLDRPVIALFYLGSGCLHCAEQVKAFGQKAKDFADAGFTLIAISTDDLEGLKISVDNYGPDPIPLKLFANPTLDTFKAYRCFDDFENKPLHGTFVIDREGKIRWQDIGYEPFQDATFVLKEAQRLLAQPTNVAVAKPAGKTKNAASGEVGKTGF